MKPFNCPMCHKQLEDVDYAVDRKRFMAYYEHLVDCGVVWNVRGLPDNWDKTECVCGFRGLWTPVRNHLYEPHDWKRIAVTKTLESM